MHKYIIGIGYVKHFKLPVKAVVFIRGGHDIRGREEEPLDIDYLVQTLEGLRSEVDAYGVCSAMSMKNPTHDFLQEVARRLHTTVEFPEYCDVSNAVGAASIARGAEL